MRGELYEKWQGGDIHEQSLNQSCFSFQMKKFVEWLEHAEEESEEEDD